jgi:hypothetical protein
LGLELVAFFEVLRAHPADVVDEEWVFASGDDLFVAYGEMVGFFDFAGEDSFYLFVSDITCDFTLRENFFPYIDILDCFEAFFRLDEGARWEAVERTDGLDNPFG